MVWSESDAQDETALIRIILKILIFWFIIWPSHCQSGGTFQGVLSIVDSSSELVFGHVSDKPLLVVLKLFWDSEMSASSDFTLQQRKKSAVVISGK